MEENKNLTPEESVEEVLEATEDFDIEEAVKSNKKGLKLKFKKKASDKPRKIKNQAFLKRGSYSMAITAIVVAGIIIFNVLVSALSDRFVLEFDMSTEKDNSISEENLEYIKSVEDEVEVIICATEDEYKGDYMAYFAQQYGVTEDATAYHEQTVNLINRYGDYNNKIKIKFMDTQSSEFAAISSAYSNDNLAYGDIIVTATKNGNTRHKVIKYTDIYTIYTDDTYAAYGYSTGSVSSNNIETALTGAISYVLSSETKRIGIITGHSATDLTADYIELLNTNNYETEIIKETMITSIDSKLDALVIAAPTIDFTGAELDAISKFLENDGKLNKGLVLFASATAPYLPNLSDFISEWGIGIDEGIVFETDSDYHIPDVPTAFVTLDSGKDDITSSMNGCITGNNVPLSILFEQESYITVTPLMTTSETVVAAPVGTTDTWTGAGDYEKQTLYGAIQSAKATYDDDNNRISSHVFVFSSADFIYSDYNELSSVSNKDLTLAAAERAANAENGGISFVSKIITTESYAGSVTESSVNLIRTIFVIILPLATLIVAVFVYIKRRNA